MRIAAAALVMLALPAIAAAQSSAASQGATLPPIGLPLPAIGGPLPPIGLPLPPIGLTPPAPTTPAVIGHVPHPDRPDPRRSRRGVLPAPVVYYFPAYGWQYLQPPPPVTHVTIVYAPVVAPAPPPKPEPVLAPPPPAPAEPPSPPPAPSTLYYIPGCYMGNVPPVQISLPAKCDLSRLITRYP